VGFRGRRRTRPRRGQHSSKSWITKKGTTKTKKRTSKLKEEDHQENSDHWGGRKATKFKDKDHQKGVAKLKEDDH